MGVGKRGDCGGADAGRGIVAVRTPGEGLWRRGRRERDCGGADAGRGDLHGLPAAVPEC